jgi:hypothetical protein
MTNFEKELKQIFTDNLILGGSTEPIIIEAIKQAIKKEMPKKKEPVKGINAKNNYLTAGYNQYRDDINQSLGIKEE